MSGLAERYVVIEDGKILPFDHFWVWYANRNAMEKEVILSEIQMLKDKVEHFVCAPPSFSTVLNSLCWLYIRQRLRVNLRFLRKPRR